MIDQCRVCGAPSAMEVRRAPGTHTPRLEPAGYCFACLATAEAIDLREPR